MVHMVPRTPPSPPRVAEGTAESKQPVDIHPFVATPCQPEVEAQKFAAAPLLQLQLLATPVVQLVIVLDPRATLPDVALPKKVTPLQLGRFQNGDLSATKHNPLNRWGNNGQQLEPKTGTWRASACIKGPTDVMSHGHPNVLSPMLRLERSA